MKYSACLTKISDYNTPVCKDVVTSYMSRSFSSKYFLKFKHLELEQILSNETNNGSGQKGNKP